MAASRLEVRLIVGTSVPHVSRLHDDASESCCAMRYPMISSWDLIKPSDESLTLNNIMVRSSEDLSSGRFAARFRSGSWPLRGLKQTSTTMDSKPAPGFGIVVVEVIGARSCIYLI